MGTTVEKTCGIDLLPDTSQTSRPRDATLPLLWYVKPNDVHLVWKLRRFTKKYTAWLHRSARCPLRNHVPSLSPPTTETSGRRSCQHGHMLERLRPCVRSRKPCMFCRVRRESVGHPEETTADHFRGTVAL